MDNNLYICDNCKSVWIGEQLCTCSSFNKLRPTNKSFLRKSAKNSQNLTEAEIVLRYLQGNISIHDIFVNVNNENEMIQVINFDDKPCLMYVEKIKTGHDYGFVELKPLKEYGDDHQYRWCRKK